MNVLPAIDPKYETEHITAFIKSVVLKSGLNNVIVAVSGGVDSATSLMLSIRALGSLHVRLLLLPYGALSDQAMKDTQSVIEQADIPSDVIEAVNIQSMVDSFNNKKDLDIVRLGNVMARIRMTVLFDRAKKHQALVVGTENKSEHQLGYFTRFGDEASDIEPIRHLYKTQVYELARFLDVPETILNKTPTAGLWKDQTDEKEFGFTYKEADQILYGLYELHLSEKGLVEKGFSEETVKNIKQWVGKNQFKHEVPFIYTRQKK